MSYTASAWPGSWLNGWMAALGVLRSTDLKLRFTRDPVPKPVFETRSGGTPTAQEMAAAIPTLGELQLSSLTRGDALPGDFPRKPTRQEYAIRAEHARATSDRLLGSTVTDLTGEDVFPHSPFDAVVPKGLTLWNRVVSCVGEIEHREQDLLSSLEGSLPRVKLNGLGFDPRRVAASTASEPEKYIDPVVEALAFQAIAMFPIRGRVGSAACTRGWVSGLTALGSFSWPVWTAALDWSAVDALLDEFWSLRPSKLEKVPGDTPTQSRPEIIQWRLKTARLGVMGAYWSIPYMPTGTSDTTRAYGSEELWMTP